MKTISLNLSHITILIVLLMFSGISSINAQLLYKDSHLFIGQKPANDLDEVGNAPGLIIGPNFGIEYFENGINFWRLWPASDWGNYKFFIDATGKIGIGRKPTTYALEVNGQVWTTSGLLVTSDGTLKRNIENISDNRSKYLNKLTNLHGKHYEKQIISNQNNTEDVAKMVAAGKIRAEDAQTALNSLNNMRKNAYKKEFGFIAQEVKEVFPELVEEGADGIFAVNYTGLIPVLLEAIKELQDRVSELEDSGSPQLTVRTVGQNPRNEGIVETEYLSQNVPNPVHGNAKINYFLPEETKNAEIIFYSINGSVEKIVQLDVNSRTGNIIISSSDFLSGIHVYKLAVNSVVLDSKKMIIQ
jgi:hypothetical protein